MILRSLALLSIGAMLALGIPSLAAAQSTDTTATATSTVPVKPKPKKASAKTTAKPKSASASAKARRPVAKPASQAKAPQPQRTGLFAALFGGSDRTAVGAQPKTVSASAAGAPQRVLARKPLPGLAAPLAVAAAQPLPVQQMALTPQGNQGELRSERTLPRSGFFGALFGDDQVMLPETRALDAALEPKRGRRSSSRCGLSSMPQEVAFSGYSPGTIVIDTVAASPLPGREAVRPPGATPSRSAARACSSRARSPSATSRNGRAGSRPGHAEARAETIRPVQGRHARRRPKIRSARARSTSIEGKQGHPSAHPRHHPPQSIGTNASNGCFRMINEHVMDLYSRVKVGTKVVFI